MRWASLFWPSPGAWPGACWPSASDMVASPAPPSGATGTFRISRLLSGARLDNMSTKTEKPARTMAEIRRRNKAIGHHWFDPGTMRFFASKIEAGPYVGLTASWFVTSEKPPHGPRGYAVRQALPGGEIESVEVDGSESPSGVCAFRTRLGAMAHARELARDDRGGAE